MATRSRAQQIASHFMQSVVVIDDRLSFGDSAGPGPAGVVEPSEVELPASDEDALGMPCAEEEALDRDQQRRAASQLDGRLLVDSFAEAGLVCSLLQADPSNADELRERLGLLATRADAFVIDWVLDTDDGLRTLDLITQLVAPKDAAGDRLRLVCIYTNEPDLIAIRDRVFQRLSDALPDESLISAPRDTPLPTLAAAEISDAKTGDARDKPLAETLANGASSVETLSDARPAPDDGKTEATSLERGLPGLSVYVQGPGFRVAVLAKAGVPLGGRAAGLCVDERALAGRVIDEFAAATDGLLQGLALEALAVLRDNARALLQRFNSGLDPAYVSHALLTDEPEEFAVQLVVHEIEALLDSAEVRKQVYREHLLTWAKAKAAEPAFAPRVHQSAKKPPVRVSGDWVVQLAENKADALKTIMNPAGENLGSSAVGTYASLSRAFTSTEAEAEIADHRLAMMSCLARSAFERQPASPPVLRLGAVLTASLSESPYWLCIQPICDSVRLTESRAYPLIPLRTADTKRPEFDVVLQDLTGTMLQLRSSTQPFETRMQKFAPSEFQVRAVKEPDGTYAFTDVTGVKFTWLADLRPHHALRIAHKSAHLSSRVGLDESEWLVRNGRNRNG